MEKTTTIWGHATVFMPNEHSHAVIIPKELVLAFRISRGDKLRFKTTPDGTIVIEKIPEAGMG